MDGQTKGYVFAILSSLLMPTAFIANYVALQSINIASLTFYFFGFGLIGAVVSLLVTGKVNKAVELFRKHWKPIAILGLVNGTTAIVWFFALKLIGPSSLGFLMRFATVFAVGLGVVYLKESFNRGEIFGGAMMIVGAFVMTFKGGDHMVTGALIAFFLSLVVALEQLFLKKYVKHVEPIVFNALRLAFTFLVVSVYVMARADLTMPNSDILFLIFITSILSAVVGFVFYFKALEISDMSKVASIQSLNPFIVFVYSLIFLGIIPTEMQLVGGVIIGLGAFFLVLARHKPRIIEKIMPNW